MSLYPYRDPMLETDFYMSRAKEMLIATLIWRSEISTRISTLLKTFHLQRQTNVVLEKIGTLQNVLTYMDR